MKASEIARDEAEELREDRQAEARWRDATCSFSALMRVQKEVLSMQGKAQSQGETLRRIGNSRDAAHYVTAAIVLNEVAQLIAEEVSKMNDQTVPTEGGEKKL